MIQFITHVRHFFGNWDYPKPGQRILLRWNDNTETDVIWQWGCIDWSKEILPISWIEIKGDDQEDGNK